MQFQLHARARSVNFENPCSDWLGEKINPIAPRVTVFFLVPTVHVACQRPGRLQIMPPKSRKKSAKGKEKKLRRKQEQAEVAAALAVVKEAYEVGDHMTGLPAFKAFNRNGLELVVSFHKGQELSREELQWAFQLMKSSVESFYVSGGWGWSDRDKWEELTHESACFIMARQAGSQQPVGFINFRFDLDDNTEVVYCYEIHLCAEIRRKGLGKFLMQILELIGHRAKMKKVVLTVFKENTISNNFFREKMNYTDDDTDPSLCDPLNADSYSYSILSKMLVKPVKPAGPARPVVPAIGSREGAQQMLASETSPRKPAEQASKLNVKSASQGVASASERKSPQEQQAS